MTVVTVPVAEVRRHLSPDMFLDLVPESPAVFGGQGDVLEVNIDAMLTAEQVEAVRTRLTTADDVEQARRVNLAALREAAVADPSLENVSALAVATATYLLGDSP